MSKHHTLDTGSQPYLSQSDFLHSHALTKFDMHMCHDEMNKKPITLILLVQQEVSHLDFCCHFLAFLLSMPCTLTNSYRFNTTEFTFSQFHNEDEHFSPMSYLVGVWRFAIAMNMSMHQYCVTSIVPPTGDRQSHKHHPICMNIYVVFST